MQRPLRGETSSRSMPPGPPIWMAAGSVAEKGTGAVRIHLGNNIERAQLLAQEYTNWMDDQRYSNKELKTTHQ